MIVHTLLLGITRPFITLTLVTSLISLYFHIDVGPPNVALFIIIILRIPLSHGPSCVIDDPRNTGFRFTSPISADIVPTFPGTTTPF